MTQSRIVRNGDTPEYYFEERCYITEWLNSPSDEDVSVASVRVACGTTTRRHILRGAAERYVILKGEGRVAVGALQPETVGPGDVVVIAPDAPQQITNTGGSDLVFLAICTPRFTPAAYEDVDEA